MKKFMPIAKNIIICILAVTCALLTTRLWFGNFFDYGLFSGAPVAAASMANHRMSNAMVESAKMAMSMDGQSYEVIYSGLHGHPAWQLSRRAISAVINEGSASGSGTLDEDSFGKIFATQNIVIQYNFSMPAGFFREQFGQRPGFLSSVFNDFQTLVISSDQEAMNFFFINNTSGAFSSFSLNNQQIYNDFHIFFTESADDAHRPQHIRNDLDFLPTGDENLPLISRNPIGDQLLLADVRPFVAPFFPNPAAMSEFTIDGVYTYLDNLRMVKFYPANIIEYNALLGSSSSSAASFTSSFLAALDMLDRDMTNMQARETSINDVFLTGYSIGPMAGQWNFYFDYVVSGSLVYISNDIEILNHAAEIRVVNNDVLQYRRLMLYFFERTGF